MRLELAVFVVAAAFAVDPARAQVQLNTPIHLLPVVMHAPGVAPSFWKSDVFVYNYGNLEAKVGFAFFPEGGGGTFSGSFPESQTRTLAPGQTVLIEDVVLSMFGYDNRKGILLVTNMESYFPSNPAHYHKVQVTSRTYNTGSDPRGTFSQTATNVMYHLNYTSSPSFVTGARLDSKFRCNLAIGSFLGSVPITVHFRVHRGDGTVAAEGTRILPAMSIGQWSLTNLGVQPTEGPLSVELWLDPASVTPNYCTNVHTANSFFAFVSPVDGARAGEGTGDGELLVAVPSDDAALCPSF
jgi:hypothetical protein